MAHEIIAHHIAKLEMEGSFSATIEEDRGTKKLMVRPMGNNTTLLSIPIPELSYLTGTAEIIAVEIADIARQQNYTLSGASALELANFLQTTLAQERAIAGRG